MLRKLDCCDFAASLGNVLMVYQITEGKGEADADEIE